MCMSNDYDCGSDRESVLDSAGSRVRLHPHSLPTVVINARNPLNLSVITITTMTAVAA